MTLSDWIIIGVAAVCGPLLGAVASSMVRRLLEKTGRPEALQKAANPISSLVFWLFVVVSLIVILGVFRPAVVDKLADDFVDFIPKGLVAAIILIGANVLSTFAATAMAPALARMPLDIAQKVTLIVRVVIITFAALLAVSQIGIDTEVVNMAVGAVLFALAASFALLIGFGGRPVAQQVASARSLRRMIEPGDELTTKGFSGSVIQVGPTHVTLSTAEGDKAVPAKSVLQGSYSLTKSEPSS